MRNVWSFDARERDNHERFRHGARSAEVSGAKPASQTKGGGQLHTTTANRRIDITAAIEKCRVFEIGTSHSSLSNATKTWHNKHPFS